MDVWLTSSLQVINTTFTYAWCLICLKTRDDMLIKISLLKVFTVMRRTCKTLNKGGERREREANNESGRCSDRCREKRDTFAPFLKVVDLTKSSTGIDGAQGNTTGIILLSGHRAVQARAI